MRKTLIAAGAMALALTVGACGDNGETGGAPFGGNAGQNGGGVTTDSKFNNAQGLVEAAKSSTSKAKTSKMSMEMNIGSMMSMTANGEGEYAGADSKMKMTMSMDMSGMPGAASQAGQMNIDMVMLDGFVYMKMPQGLGSSDPDKPWVKMSVSELESGTGQQFSQSMDMSDPSKLLEMVQESGEILATEPTTVDGQQATKYSVEVDFAKMSESMGQTVPPNMPDDLTLPMDITLNSENLPMVIEMDMGEMMKKIAEEMGQQLPAGMDTGKMVAKYSDWGAPVDVQAPPADQVSEQGIPSLGGN